MSSPAHLMVAASPTPESVIAVGTALMAATRETVVMIAKAMIVMMVTGDEGDCNNGTNNDNFETK